MMFCTGAMAVVGSIQSGVAGNHEVLYAKALMDGIFCIPFAATHGTGVLFSLIPVMVYQGAIALLGAKLTFLSGPRLLHDLSGVGGVLLMMIGTNQARITSIRVGDYIPAIFLVIAYAAVFAG
jgi:uncharacterized membrane protein YqgA involved in biofilm formation